MKKALVGFLALALISCSTVCRPSDVESDEYERHKIRPHKAFQYLFQKSTRTV